MEFSVQLFLVLVLVLAASPRRSYRGNDLLHIALFDARPRHQQGWQILDILRTAHLLGSSITSSRTNEGQVH